MHAGAVGFDRLAGEGFLRGHVDAGGCLDKEPFVDSGDAAGRASLQHAGVVGCRVDGGDDGEAVAGPFDGRAALERAVQARRGDVKLRDDPPRPALY